jgi:hypothetical protein
VKILYITSMLFKKGSSASIRNVSLLNGLSQNGSEVEVLTVLYPNLVKDPYLQKTISPRIKVTEYDCGYISRFVPNHSLEKGLATKNPFIEFKKVVKELFFFPDVDKAWMNQDFSSFKDKTFDLIISSSDTKTSHFVAKKLLGLSKFPIHWAQIWGDPWFGDVGKMSVLKRRRVRIAEIKLLNSSSSIHYVSKPTKDWMSEKYSGISSKMFYLSRGFLDKMSVGDNVIRKVKKFIYSGVLAGRNLIPLMESLNFEIANKGALIQFDYYGRLNASELLELEKFSFFKFKGLVDLNSVNEAYKDADVLVYLGNVKGSTQIPGKLYDYFGTTKCILALVEDMTEAVSEFIRSTNRCLVFQNNQAEIDITTILNQLNGWESMKEYSPQFLADKLLSQIGLK